jgi:reactive intermediate/imine deaminase
MPNPMKKVLPWVVAALSLAWGAFGQAPTFRAGVPRFMSPATMAKPNGYSHLVAVRGGTTIYVAGQVALDRQGTLIGTGDFRAQAQQAFENMKAALEGSGATFKDVVKLNNYLVDMSQLPAFREVRDRYINTASPPASTTVEVRKLFRDDVLVEIEAVAVIP